MAKRCCATASPPARYRDACCAVRARGLELTGGPERAPAASHRAGEEAGAFVALLGGLERERQANVSIAAAVGVEHRPRRVLHAQACGALRELARIGAARQP